MSFPAYPTYKNSDVEWLGVVPDHWAVTLLKRGYQVVLGKMLQPEPRRDDDEFLPYLRAANIQLSGVDTGNVKRMWFGAEEKKSLLLRRGDLLVSEGGDVGRSAIWDFDDEECYFQNSINRIRSIDGNSTRFLYFWMIAIKTNGYIDVLCNKSTIAHFTAEKVAAVPLPMPTKSEQTQIARFLDHETARINALIEEQQRLIELLKEKRQAVISHAVTKGLDPTVPMKDSGVEWLGEVPAHWSSIQVGRVCRKVSDGPHFSPNYVDEGVMFLSARNIAMDGWQLDDAKFVSEEDYLEFCRRIIPEKGDVLYTKGGTTGIARVVDLDDRFQVWVHVAVLKLDREQVDPYYMAFSLNSIGCYEQSQLYTRGATNQDLGLTRMIKIWFSLPPREEQIRICEVLSMELSKIDDLIAEAATVTRLLGERRSALISAAVTGKIDVRGWQPPASATSLELVQETA
ncbi:restriction endonuclease subunit S [Pseudomonas syringae]|uniref:Type I restriction modification DNA specificity domain-containing protein n=1 Tax=Pseudomonas syringae TaxID=317 RepID=A0A085VRJ7_PSESX|nr:restriction endonuclease subunit S [Pseudomonas syringae]KFE58060.1 hypothetical protein IV01_00365 [Pseudomonas syringae]